MYIIVDSNCMVWVLGHVLVVTKRYPNAVCSYAGYIIENVDFLNKQINSTIWGCGLFDQHRHAGISWTYSKLF